MFFLIRCIAVSTILLPFFLLGAQEIVVSEFGEKGEGGLPSVLEGEQALPLKHPTSVGVQEPSKITHQIEGVGDYKKPLVVFELGEHPDNPQAAAAAKIEWKFSSAELGAGGVYELEYTIIPLSPPVVGGRMKLGVVDASGAPLTVSLHFSKLPSLSFQNDGYGIAGTVAPVTEGTPMEVKITLDLNENTWAATVDGKLLIDPRPLHEELTSAHPQLAISSIDFGSDSGWSDKPNTTYALGKVKLVRLPDKKAE